MKTMGRPEGKRYPHVRSLRLDEQSVERLRGLAERLEIDQAAVIRRAIRVLAVQEGIAP